MQQLMMIFCYIYADVSEIQQKEETDVTEVQQVDQEGSRGEQLTAIKKQLYALNKVPALNIPFISVKTSNTGFLPI